MEEEGEKMGEEQIEEEGEGEVKGGKRIAIVGNRMSKEKRTSVSISE